MNQPGPTGGCAGCPLSRRRFLATSGAAVAGGAAALWMPPASSAEAAGLASAKVRIVYSLHAREAARARLAEQGLRFRAGHGAHQPGAGQALPGLRVRHVDGHRPGAGQKILEDDKSAGIDGYLVYQMNCWNRVVQTIAGIGQAGALCRFPVRRQRRVPGLHGGVSCAQKAPNVGFVASSRDRGPGRGGQVLHGVRRRAARLPTSSRRAAQTRVARTPQSRPIPRASRTRCNACRHRRSACGA